MGVHDYISFIQRNGQCLIEIEPSQPEENNTKEDIDPDSLESDSCGLAEAVLVKVPMSFSKDDITRWYPQQFATYQFFKTGYSWDNIEFEFEENDGGLREYFEAISSGEANDGLWESSHYPGVWLVVFTPKEHDIFVMGKYTDPNDISYSYYSSVFKGRQEELPNTKEEAFGKIMRNFNPTLTKPARISQMVKHRNLPSGISSGKSESVEFKITPTMRPHQSGDFVDISLGQSHSKTRFQIHSIISDEIYIFPYPEATKYPSKLILKHGVWKVFNAEDTPYTLTFIH